GWNQWVNRAIFDAEGRAIEFQAVGRDITERRRAEEELRQSEERWRMVFLNSAVGIAVSEAFGCFFSTNAVFERMLGYTKEELRRLSFVDVTHEDDRETSLRVAQELMSGRRQQVQF